MNNITYGQGAIFIHPNDDNEIIFNCNEAILEFTEIPDAINKEKIRSLMANEATFEIHDAKIDRQLWYRLAYGHPWQWPVSNNWLKSHGHGMRRYRQIRKAVSCPLQYVTFVCDNTF